MSKKAASAAYEEVLLEDLKDPEEAAAYLNVALEENDPSVFLLALSQVAQAQGMASVARKAHVGRESLYKTLSENGNPELRTINRLLHAMGDVHPHALKAQLARELSRLTFERWLPKSGVLSLESRVGGRARVIAGKTIFCNSGFEAVEVALSGTGDLGLTTTEKEAQAVVRAAHDAGIRISSVATGLFWGKSLSADDPAVRAAQVRHLLRFVAAFFLRADALQGLLELRGHGHQVLAGVDLSGEQIEIARSRLARITSDETVVRLAKASATELPFEDASFDAVISNAMIKYLDDAGMQAFLAESARVLRPGGWLAMGEFGRDAGLLAPGARRAMRCGPERFRSEKQQAELLVRAGFIETRGFQMRRLRRIPFLMEGASGQLPA